MSALVNCGDRCNQMPRWRKGDVLAIPQDLCRRGGAVSRGCHVFVAEYDPVYSDGEWRYGSRNANEVRPATIEDVERLIGIVTMDLVRECKSLARLEEIKGKFNGQ